MDGNAVGLLLKLLVKVQGTRQGRKLLANETCIKSCINACIVYWYSKQESTIYKYESLKFVQLITRLAGISQFLILFVCTYCCLRQCMCNRYSNVSRQVTRTKSKSGAVVKHQKMFVVYKTTSKCSKMAFLRAVLLLFSDFRN